MDLLVRTSRLQPLRLKALCAAEHERCMGGWRDGARKAISRGEKIMPALLQGGVCLDLSSGLKKTVSEPQWCAGTVVVPRIDRSTPPPNPVSHESTSCHGQLMHCRRYRCSSCRSYAVLQESRHSYLQLLRHGRVELTSPHIPKEKGKLPDAPISRMY